ncbi:fluoride efflux transporter CrcB [Amycolatopsis jiangsuensis]|uniref:Fluoride-specific ion channel FluC n=1 Tax=Amycolatopsis jiangsuensis TaxID=1181879 RepID=A0A840IPJ4_9PSEU|nr:fluoride efflux transporter CrcB [Amycolatopsis jiangsuensis]MBB4683102.1 CrcB protein [Amycolatopsis jiangsuensis]
MTVLLVFLGGAVGAPLRYLTDRAVQSRHQSLFPWGTLTVNLAGCLVLGGLTGAGAALPAPLFALLGTGFCGALTTYSTFGYETVRLAERRAYLAAVANVVVSLAAGFGGAVFGYEVVQALVS